MVSSHTTLPGLTIATHQINYGSLWPPLYLNLNSISLNKQENPENPETNCCGHHQHILVAKQKVPNVTQPKHIPQPQNLEIREIDRHDRKSHQNYKFKHRHCKSDRQNITLPLLQLSSNQGDWSPGLPILQTIAYCSCPKTKIKINTKVRSQVNFKMLPPPVISSSPNLTSRNQSNNLVMQ